MDSCQFEREKNVKIFFEKIKIEFPNKFIMALGSIFYSDNNALAQIIVHIFLVFLFFLKNCQIMTLLVS